MHINEQWVEARIFISSTFSDMHTERDVLTRMVVPSLQKWFEKYRIRVLAVDLRWGINDETLLNDNVVDICNRAIDECKPYFLFLLGRRYGEITKTGNQSVTHLELLHALQIRSLDGPIATPPILAYQRDDASLPDPNELSGLSSSARQSIKKSYFSPVGEADIRLQELRQLLNDSTDITLKRYHLDYQIHNNELVYTQESRRMFADQLRDDMLVWLQDAFKERVAWYEDEYNQKSLGLFSASSGIGREAQYRFVGREALRSSLLSAIQSTSGFFCLCGEEGMGKTWLTKKLYTDAAAIADTAFIPLDLTDPVYACMNETQLCDEVMMMLSQYIDIHAALKAADPKEYNNCQSRGEWRYLRLSNMSQGLPSILHACKAHIAVFTDSATFAQRYAQLKWPDNAVLVFTKDGEAPSFATESVTIGGYLPEDITRIVDTVPSIYLKNLTQSQKQRIIAKKGASRPLYLYLLLNELTLFGKYDQLEDYIDSLPETLEDIIQYYFDRINADLDSNDGRFELLMACFYVESKGFLVEEMNGFWETQQWLPQNDAIKPYLPEDPFLMTQLEVFLNKNGNRLVLDHSVFRRAVAKRYEKEIDDLRKHCRCEADQWISNWRSGEKDTHLAWHIMRNLMWSGSWKEAADMATDMKFMPLLCKNPYVYANDRYDQYSRFLSYSEELKNAGISPEASRRLESLLVSLPDALTVLNHLFYDNMDHYDPNVRCKICGHQGLYHQHAEFGASGTDYYDHYIVFCPECFYHWGYDYYNMSGEEALVFDPKSCTF